MNLLQTRRRLVPILLSCCLLPCLPAFVEAGVKHGRVSGIVTDTQGNPLMGATVLVIGPVVPGLHTLETVATRIITDARGQFTVERLVPGWYSLRVTAPTRMPALHSGIRVEAGQTFLDKFALGDILAPVRFQLPSHTVSTWGEDWKWVLRTSAATRPVLRYRQVAKITGSSKTSKASLRASRRLVGMVPGSARREVLAGDPGLGSVLAYLRPLSQDSDLLVSGSLTANGVQASSLSTAFRRNLLKGDPQEVVLAVHQLSFSDGVRLASRDDGERPLRAQGMVFNYGHTRRLSDSVILTVGFEVNYLSAERDALAALPRMTLQYQLSPSTVVGARYGAAHVDGSSTLLERVGALNTFPRVTLRGYRPQLEQLNHAEVSLSRKIRDTARLEIAAYRDAFQNAAVWGFGSPGALPWLAGDFLPNPTAGGVIVNAGDYRSSGFRLAYAQKIGSNLETTVVYALGNALSGHDLAGSGNNASPATFRSVLHRERSQSFAAKVSARVPVSRTQVISSYQWVQGGRVTLVDPYGQASFQLQPFLGLQVRQPLPTFAFLPARIEALADFRNLLGQGYVLLSREGTRPVFLTAAYRSFRGGFSVLF